MMTMQTIHYSSTCDSSPDANRGGGGAYMLKFSLVINKFDPLPHSLGGFWWYVLFCAESSAVGYNWPN